MHKKDTALSGLLQQRLLPLFYHDDLQTSFSILEALYRAGIRLVEYVHRGPNALENFREMKQRAVSDMGGLQLGIGTIKNADQAQLYIDAGADFIVCPTTEPTVGRASDEAGLLWIPGCMTPTEIALAEESGARLVKIFPGNILGPGYISAIKDLFPGMMFMPTGGVEVDEENISSWFNAGVCAVGMGSKLVSSKLVQAQDFSGIESITRKALSLLPAQTRFMQ